MAKVLRELYKSGKFDPRIYAQTYYSRVGDEKKFYLDSLHEIFFKTLVKGKTLLDMGTGPSMYAMISASAHVEEITLSDYLESSRKETVQWLNKSPDAFDWTAFYKHVGRLENKNYTELESRVRSKVMDVVPCDVMRSNPLEPLDRQYDVILSSLCLEAAGETANEYDQSIRNIRKLVKDRGYLVLLGVFGGTEYHVGEEKLPCNYLTRAIVQNALMKAGFESTYWKIIPRPLGSKDPSNSTHCYALVAKVI